MALGDPYITRDQLKTYLSIDLAETTYDARIDDAVASASREIEQFTGRQFNKATVASTRHYEADSRSGVSVDDFWTTSGLVVGWDDLSEVTWVGGTEGLDLYPLDGVVDGVPGWPFYRIELQHDLLGYLSVPRRRRRGTRVAVTAQWGWASVPASVKQAALQLGAETFKLAEAPFGVTGSDQFGGVVRVRDLPQVARKLNRFVTTPIMVG